MTRRGGVLISIAVCAAALLIWRVFMADTTPDTRLPLHAKLRILEPLPDMLARNDSSLLWSQARRSDAPDSSLLLPVARASERYTKDPSELVLTYDAPGCPLTLPAGRQMQISFEGPVIVDSYLIYPMETMTWNEMQAMVSHTVDLFEAAGWPFKPKAKAGPPSVLRREITVEQLNKKTYGTKFVNIGRWNPCDAPHIEASAEVRHLNSAPSGPSIPPAAATSPRDPDAPDRFVMLVNFLIDNDALTGEIRQLTEARRLAVHGDADQRLPASVWLDDPGWRLEGWDGEWID